MWVLQWVILAFQLEVPDLTEGIWNIDAEDEDGNDATVQLTVEKANVSINTSGLTVSPSEVKPGEEVTITIEVANDGDIEGYYTLNLLIDESMEDTRKVTLAANTTETFIFTVSREDMGTYLVDANGLTSSFTVKDVTSSSSAPAPAPSEPAQTPTSEPNWAILGRLNLGAL